MDDTEPTKEEITKFLNIFNALSTFESNQFLFRGYGAFDRKEVVMPIPSVVKVMQWLENKCEHNVPTVAGYYWAKRKEFKTSKWQPVYVYKLEQPSPIFLVKVDGVLFPLSHFTWGAGPLEMPE